MTIKEKLITLGLSPHQTIEVTLLLCEAFTHGAVFVDNMAGSNLNAAILADAAEKVLDMECIEILAPVDVAKFSAVFGVDLTNEIP